MKNIICFIFLISLGVAGLWHASSKRSDCFSPAFIKADNKIFAPFAQQEAISTPLLPLLKQEFRFLGSGNQCYAFESADGKYVLKVIKFHCLTQNFLPDWEMLRKTKAQQMANQEQKLKRILHGFLIANESKHCGLVHVHFPPTSLSIKASLRDKAGRLHSIELSDVMFAIQYKARATREVLQELLENHHWKQATEHVSALLAMMTDDLSQGFYDHDHNIMHNTGFIEERPIRIDFGKLTFNASMKDPLIRFHELSKITHERILPWLKKNYPIYYQEFNPRILEILSQYSP